MEIVGIMVLKKKENLHIYIGESLNINYTQRNLYI